MSSSIGDLILRLLADGSQLEPAVVKEAAKAGDAGAKTLGQRLGASLKTNGVKAFGVAAAGAFALASKGALQLQNIQADFQSETGASADEAVAATKTINRVAGEQRQSLESVSAAAVVVRRDLGLIGAAGDAALDTVVRFARVTRQDAAGAAKAFDDILDSWGLTATDLAITMDKLLVSQHKFGGDITETQKTLAALAPAMRAANMTIDDGIGLLGLFGSKGLDAGQASAAFARALTKVKSPEELQKLIDDIAATEDPFARAQKAADLFGAKAGAKLANALGGAKLSEYTISVEEAAGATEKAADVIDNTFTGRIQKAISITGAKLRAFGADFGPAATGAAALASLLAPLGGGRLVKGILGSLGGLGPAIAKRIGASAGGGIAAGLSSAVTKAGSSRIVTSALTGIGKVWGSTLGKATVLGAIAIIGVELWDQLQKLNAENEARTNELGVNIGKAIVEGQIDGLQQTKGELEKAISDLNGPLMLTRSFNAGQINAFQAQLDMINAAILARDQAMKAASAGTAEDNIGAKAAADAKRVVTATEKMRDAAIDFRDKYKDAAGAVIRASARVRDQLIRDAAIIRGKVFDETETRAALHDQRLALLALEDSKRTAKTKEEKRQAADDIAQALDDEGQSLEDLADQGKLTKADVDQFASDVKANYDSLSKEGRKDIDALLARYRALANQPNITKTFTVKGVVVSVNDTHGPGRGKLEFAEGGIRPPGVASWVGEKGRELSVPLAPSLIIPHGLSEALMGMGGAPAAAAAGDVINVTIPAAKPIGSVRDVGDYLQMLERRGHLRRRR